MMSYHSTSSLVLFRPRRASVGGRRELSNEYHTYDIHRESGYDCDIFSLRLRHAPLRWAPAQLSHIGWVDLSTKEGDH